MRTCVPTILRSWLTNGVLTIAALVLGYGVAVAQGSPAPSGQTAAATSATAGGATVAAPQSLGAPTRRKISRRIQPQAYSFSLDPAKATVKPGQSVGFSVKQCDSPSGTNCHVWPLAPSVTVDGWAVNGVAGGDAAHGRIEEFWGFVSYTAPSQRPSPPKVTVSVNVTQNSGKLGTLEPLSAEVTLAAPDLTGWIEFNTVTANAPSGLRVRATVTATFAKYQSDYTVYDVTGVASVLTTDLTILGDSCTCTQPDLVFTNTSNLWVESAPSTQVLFPLTLIFDWSCVHPSDGMRWDSSYGVLSTGCPPGAFFSIDAPDHPRGTFTTTCPGGTFGFAFDLAPK